MFLRFEEPRSSPPPPRGGLQLAFGSRTPAAVGEQHAVEPQQPYPSPQSPDGNARGL